MGKLGELLSGVYEAARSTLTLSRVKEALCVCSGSDVVEAAEHARLSMEVWRQEAQECGRDAELLERRSTIWKALAKDLRRRRSARVERPSELQLNVAASNVFDVIDQVVGVRVPIDQEIKVRAAIASELTKLIQGVTGRRDG